MDRYATLVSTGRYLPPIPVDNDELRSRFPGSREVRQRSIEHVMAALGRPIERAHMIMDTWSYAGSACIPMALDDAIEQGRVKRGDLVMLVGSDVGYNQAGVACRMA